jgi:hypothetical protein
MRLGLLPESVLQGSSAGRHRACSSGRHSGVDAYAEGDAAGTGGRDIRNDPAA